jgi:hypothetical protein
VVRKLYNFILIAGSLKFASSKNLPFLALLLAMKRTCSITFWATYIREKDSLLGIWLASLSVSQYIAANTLKN